MTCDRCYQPLGVGEHGLYKCPLERRGGYQPFKAYFDIALGRQIDSQADRWRAQRQLNVQPRDGVSAGEFSARRDRIEQRKRKAAMA